jgi:endonuclease-3 related protein
VSALPAEKQKLLEMFHRMLNHFGPQDWWPADTELEVMVGAVLTQNTNWDNVEKAIANLKSKEMLNIRTLQYLSVPELAQEIRPAGYFNIKAKRLKNLIDFIVDKYDGDIQELLDEETEKLRRRLLSVNGIGPETADSILLYAASRPVFVIDAYTHRILIRHGMFAEEGTYYDLQQFFMDHLPEDKTLFGEFHALIVQTGKVYCRKKPKCDPCPLKGWNYLES